MTKNADTAPLMRERWPLSRERVGLTAFLLVSSYAFGAVVIGHGLIPGFAALTAPHLCLTAGLLLWHHVGVVRAGSPRGDRLLLWAVSCGLLGWWAEYVGVHYGFLFGEYVYGPVLGPRWQGIPIVMAVNWILVVYATCATIEQLASRLSAVAKTVIAASALVGLDLLIEPVAIRLDFWSWADGDPPLQNFVGWWGVGFLQAGIFYALLPSARNRVAPLVLILQIAFFTYLSIV